MATLNIFDSDAFSLQSMLDAIESIDFQPRRLSSMNIFTPNPVRTATVSIEQRAGVLSLIQTSERGEPLEQRVTEKRDIRDFRTVRIAKGDTIMASELAGIRAFGTESELMQVQAEVARRLTGPVGIEAQIALTKENMRLGAIQGIVKDADASTIRNWYTEFGVTQATEIDFDLDNATPASGAVRKKSTQVVRAMMKAAKGVWTPGTQIHAFCGDNFWDDLTAHVEVRETYLNTQAAASLRDGLAYEMFNYGGITWENYRGTDDGSTVGIATDQVKFFPTNAPGLFLEVNSPGEQFEQIGQLGKSLYPMIVRDIARDMWVIVEGYAYVLHVCTRPLMLQRGRRT
ncbi:MAG: major capsid protein [Candidatus Scalindua sp.]|nr:major capsid protein [Candidatus Scalindua sp.]